MESPHPANDPYLLHCTDEYVRREPTRAVIAAFGAGFFINLLPLAAIAAVLVSLAVALVRPFLLFLGLVKACEFCRLNPSQPASHD